MARYFIYRNLRDKKFSVRYQGVVIDRLENFCATDVEFRVNEAGRKRVLLEGRKNVHAFVACRSYQRVPNPEFHGDEVTYNPFKAPNFTTRGEAILTAKSVYFTNNKCYLYEYS